MSNTPDTTPEASSARDVLRTMWSSRRNEAAADLDTLLSTLESLVASPIDSDIRSRAQTQAHQLVGLFGVFGFTEPKNLMARIDIELSDPSVSLDDILSRARSIRENLP